MPGITTIHHLPGDDILKLKLGMIVTWNFLSTEVTHHSRIDYVTVWMSPEWGMIYDVYDIYMICVLPMPAEVM